MLRVVSSLLFFFFKETFPLCCCSSAKLSLSLHFVAWESFKKKTRKWLNYWNWVKENFRLSIDCGRVYISRSRTMSIIWKSERKGEKCQVLAQTKKETLEGLLFVKNISSSSRLGCWVHSISTHNCWSASQSLNRDKQRVIRCCPKMGSLNQYLNIFFFYLGKTLKMDFLLLNK